MRLFQARRSGEHWFDDLPHTTFLIFKGKLCVSLFYSSFDKDSLSSSLSLLLFTLKGINLLVKSKAFQYAMCKYLNILTALLETKFLTINCFI